MYDSKKYYRENREKIIKRTKEYQEKNKEKLIEYQRNYRLKKNPNKKSHFSNKMTDEEKRLLRNKNAREKYREKVEKEGKKIRVKPQLSEEEKRIRKNKQARESYKRKIEKEGKTLRVKKPPMTKEERKEYIKEYNRKRRLEKGYKPRVKKDPELVKLERKLKRQEKYKSIKRDKPKPKHYVQDIELTYHLILSQGKGRPTNKLYEMLFTINNKVNNIFSYRYMEDKQDVTSETFIHLLENYSSFDYGRYKKGLPYITELIKRKAASYFKKQIILKGVRNVENINWIYIDNEYRNEK